MTDIKPNSVFEARDIRTGEVARYRSLGKRSERGFICVNLSSSDGPNKRSNDLEITDEKPELTSGEWLLAYGRASA